MRRALLAALAISLFPLAAAGQEDQPPLTPPAAAVPTTQPAPPAAPPPAPRPAPAATLDQEEPRGVRILQVTPALVAGPVVRAVGGNVGMFFRFGGLANLFATGNSKSVGSASGGADALIMTQVGIKLVRSEAWMFPIYFGSSLRVISPESGDATTDWGIELGGGFEHHFRVWRRISPFVGLNLGLGVIDPTGDNNRSVGFGIGPNLGVEYYIGDRVSLSALYQFVLQVGFQEVRGSGEGSSSVTAFSFQTLAGGAMNLTYYF